MNSSAEQVSSVPDDDLNRQAHFDLSMRARGGVVIYICVWLISAVWGGIIYSDPLFFKINTLLFMVVAVLRIIHHIVLIRRPSLTSPTMYRCLVAMILCSAAHWGVMSAWVIFVSQNETLHYPYMIIIAAFAIGGPSVLSISRTISFYYPLALLLPVLIMGFISGGEENLVLIALAGFSMLYVLSSSRVSHNDYWKAITSFKEADERAKLMELASKTDALTQLYNRQHFNERFSDDWKRCCRLRLPISILMVDLDHFKKINDEYGHVAGDECLTKVASVLNSEIMRATDTSQDTVEKNLL